MAFTKGNFLGLPTFLNYNVSDVIGHKVMEKDGSPMVNFVWCKLCSKFKDKIVCSSTVKGSAKTSAMAFINGTNTVTKHQVIVY